MSDQAITVYFDLSDDQHPSLRTVAKAALAFDQMATEAAYLIEPGTSFSLVFDRSAPGSLRIISFVQGALTKERLKKLTLTLAILLTTNTVTYLQTRGLDEIVSKLTEDDPTLSKADIEAIVEAVSRAEKSKTVTEPRAEFYRTVRDDPAIQGVGSRPDSQAGRPKSVINRSEFDLMIELPPAALASDGDERVRTIREEIILDRPALTTSSRKWGFINEQGAFSATISDDRFISAMREGRTDLTLTSGIILDATIDIRQVLEDGIWRNKSYKIVTVHVWRHDPKQAEMILSHPSDDQNKKQ